MSDSELITAAESILAGDTTHVVVDDQEWAVDSILAGVSGTEIVLGRPNPETGPRIRHRVNILIPGAPAEPREITYLRRMPDGTLASLVGEEDN